MYKLVKDIDGNINKNIILRTADNAFIPIDKANTDYQKYLTWVAEGNQLEPADE